MINWKTIISNHDDKITLLNWLRKVEKALSESVLLRVDVERPSQELAILKFVFEDGSFIETPPFQLAKGDKGDTGSQGPIGPAGNGISSIVKTGTADLVDTYTIYFTNGTTTTFQVVNGADGRSFVISGQVDNASQLPALVDLGTAYFVGATAPRDVYVFLMSGGIAQWVNQGQIQGPKGDSGVQEIETLLLTFLGIEATFDSNDGITISAVARIINHDTSYSDVDMEITLPILAESGELTISEDLGQAHVIIGIDSAIKSLITNSLQKPAVAPASDVLVGIDNTNAQQNLGLGASLSKANGKVVLSYITTAPVGDNDDGLQIVVLSSDPATKYDGYLYLITE